MKTSRRYNGIVINMPTFREKSLVEDCVISQLEAKGWKFIKNEELARESLEEPMLVSDLIGALKRINANSGLGDEEIKKVLNELKLKGSGIEGVKQILNFFKQGVPVKFEKEKVLKYVKLFDFENLGNNDFIVSRQVWFHGREKRRLDALLYVNGIPLVNIECKDPTNPAESSYIAYRQIKDYEKTLPELYKYVQIGVAICETARYFPIVPWLDDVKWEKWKFEVKDSVDSVIEMLSPEILLDLIKNFIFVREERGKTTKVIARYMQYRSVNKVVERVIKNLRGDEEPNKGLIWHWQGSGKTLEMVFSANKLFKALGNPTVFFILDRTDLEKQLYEEYTALDISPLPEKIETINGLVNVLKHGGGIGKRGIFTVLIQKFREEIQEFKELEPAITNRRDIIVFADEGHRTQYGSLAARMRNILKKAFFFAFTGTPIKKEGRDTYEIFSNLPDEKYLDKYFITDSISDGFTLKIAYQPRLEKEVHLKKEDLKFFLEQEFDELPEETRERVEEKIKKKLNTLKVILKNIERVRLVAKDIAQHFKENVDEKFKAMVVAVDRETCVLYKRELDGLLPKEYSELVMTFSRTDPKIIRDYLDELRERYNGKEIEDIIKEIIDKFKDEENPKILIVTDMLLTGFDAPILQTMYLDKPLKEHRLLQAIARTNRPYNDVKEAGLIIDYLGILKEFKRAFEIYSDEEIKNAVYSPEKLQGEFRELLNRVLELFKDIRRDYERETLMNAFDVLSSDEKTAKEFLRSYRKLRKIFELLGPDVVKAELFNEYKWISAIFVYYTRLVDRRGDPVDQQVRKYFNRTLRYVYLATELEKIKKDLPLIQFDDDYLRKLEEKVKSEDEKAADIVFTLNRWVLVERYKNPIYESVADKVERILKSWKERTEDFKKIYSESTAIIKEIFALKKRQRQLGLSDMEYSILLVFEKEDKKIKLEEIISFVESIKSQMFSNWNVQQSAQKAIGRIVRRFLRMYKPGLEERERLYEKIMRCVENYGKTD